ncbi:MAG: hypothetical protein Q8O67_10365 [Deltaproteobacteria bacterium]|nr:hypothetical protein [Deltaproteobacteria bacterium]
MARSKTATTTTTTKDKATEARRVSSLEPKGGRQLSSLEEAVVRMHHGVSVKAEATLQTNSVTDELASQLLDLEVDAHIATGRADELPDVPADDRTNGKPKAGNAKSQKLVAALKK